MVRNVLGYFVLNSAEKLVPYTRRYQVLVSPGAMRFVSSSIGKRCPPACTSHVSEALSHVSQGTIVPPGPGRSVRILDSSARTLRGNQPTRRGMWSTCIPRPPIQPYSPLAATRPFRFIRVLGPLRLLRRMPA